MDIEHIERVARALHAKARVMLDDETDIPLTVVEMIVCDAHLIFVEGLPVESWESEIDPRD